MYRDKYVLKNVRSDTKSCYSLHFVFRGVYSTQTFNSGDYICSYHGVIQEEEPSDIDDTYIFEIGFKGKRLW